MTPLLMIVLALVIVVTSFLSGLFGMAGGMILIGVLLAVLPVPAAMVLHAFTQMASNGWRGLLWWRHVRWRTVMAFQAGSVVALGAWALTGYVPDQATALVLLGVTPFLVRLAPGDLKPDPDGPVQGVLYGAICMTLMLLTGVAGPLLDTYFLGGALDRREIVATKAMCQLLTHALKLAYFGGIVAQAASLDPVFAVVAILASMLGTMLARRILEAMSDAQYRLWANRLITAIAGWFVAYGTYLFVLAK